MSVHVTEAEEIWLAMVLTEELVALNPTTRSKYHRLQCDCSLNMNMNDIIGIYLYLHVDVLVIKSAHDEMDL